MRNAILVGDVGGTNVRFAVAHLQNGLIQTENFSKLAGDDFGAFDEALGEYLQREDVDVGRACFALAGPVKDGEVLLTNRPWQVSAKRLCKRFGFEDVCLINDFTAMARSVPEHHEDNFESVLDGTADLDEPIIVAGPGTGFGVATLLPDGGNKWHVMNGEGGHIAYAPREPLEFEVARMLMHEHGYVSNELVASGMGLDSVYAAFCKIFARAAEDVSPQEMRNRADAGDEMFDKLIAMRANAVMGAAGDLVLAYGALGGVVLAGGVTERIIDYLRRPEAVARFRERGPMSSYLADCPVRIMHDPEAPLVGAAAFYAQEKFA